MSIAGPDWFFADSTNSIAVSEQCAVSNEYILALLNSKLFQWRFKLTSTNNNVGTNELEALPVKVVLFSDRSEKALYDRIVSRVQSAARMGEEMEAAVSDRARKAALSMFDEVVEQIDDDVFSLYGLSGRDRALVEAAVR